MSCGDGARGPRVYDWVAVAIRSSFAHGRRGWVLARRNITTGELVYYRCFGPRGTRLRTLVTTAGARWAVEESFQTAKNEAGLDQYQVRRYDAWYAHITLAMAAAAFLVIARTAEAVKGNPRQRRQDGLIPLTSNEIRRLFASLVLTIHHGYRDILAWSTFRRRRQDQARDAHYRKRLDRLKGNDSP
jgi:hypothetical protein